MPLRLALLSSLLLHAALLLAPLRTRIPLELETPRVLQVRLMAAPAAIPTMTPTVTPIAATRRVAATTPTRRKVLRPAPEPVSTAPPPPMPAPSPPPVATPEPWFFMPAQLAPPAWVASWPLRVAATGNGNTAPKTAAPGEPAASGAPNTTTPSAPAAPPAMSLIAPRPLSAPAPAYPALARERGEEGALLLRLRINANGQVQRLHLLRSSGHSLLDEAAIETLRAWRFAPAQQGSARVPATLDVPVRFELRTP